MMSAAH